HYYLVTIEPLYWAEYEDKWNPKTCFNLQKPDAKIGSQFSLLAAKRALSLHPFHTKQQKFHSVNTKS
ncbi:MAG: hypothetical protein AAFY48_18450, partial [Bacteroidota bacterium]